MKLKLTFDEAHEKTVKGIVKGVGRQDCQRTGKVEVRGDEVLRSGGIAAGTGRRLFQR